MDSLKETDFKRLIMFIHDNYGIDLRKKRGLLEGRLYSIMCQKGFNSYSEYINYVFSNPSKEEIIPLINKLTTNHTFFMREAEHFKFLENVVLPNLEYNSKDKDLRIWSAGCSSGEEPYTLSMILQDYFHDVNTLWNTQLLATDICSSVLEVGRKGIYTYEAIKNLPISWRLNYFKKINDNNYEVCNNLKNNVIFRLFNLMDKNYPFKKKFHVIFCRNVMIYFDEATKKDLVNKFYYCTEPGGYLFIGHSETIDRETSNYKYIMPSVYRKE